MHRTKFLETLHEALGMDFNTWQAKYRAKNPKIPRKQKAKKTQSAPILPRHAKRTAEEHRKFRLMSYRATQKVHRAVLQGRLKNLKKEEIVCVDCKVNRAVCYDHRNYSKPLCVDPVCHDCNLRRGPADYVWREINRFHEPSMPFYRQRPKSNAINE